MPQVKKKKKPEKPEPPKWYHMLGAGVAGVSAFALANILARKLAQRGRPSGSQPIAMPEPQLPGVASPIPMPSPKLTGPPAIPMPEPKFSAAKKDMPDFLDQDRPEKVKDIYSALKRDHPEMSAEMKARIASRQGKKGKQKQGPPYKAPIGKDAGLIELPKEVQDLLLSMPESGMGYQTILNCTHLQTGALHKDAGGAGLIRGLATADKAFGFAGGAQGTQAIGAPTSTIKDMTNNPLSIPSYASNATDLASVAGGALAKAPAVAARVAPIASRVAQAAPGVARVVS
ncbi:unnamed protein product, partial [marine sediment metagenome]